MHWMISAAFTILALALADFLVKLTGGKISNSLALLLYGSCTFLAGLTWVVIELIRKEKLFAQPVAVATGLGVGVAFAAVTFGLYATYTKVPVSVGSPVIRLGAIVVVSLAGILLLKERLSVQYVVGMLFAVTGIVFLVLHNLRG
jgi:drug/metabolite transporter (DMT)-like permease